MQIIIEAILTVILCSLNFILVFFTFVSRRRLSNLKTFLVLCMGLFCTFTIGVLLRISPLPIRFQLGYISIFCTVSVLLCKIIFQCKLTEILFVYFIVQGYIDDCFMLAKWLQNLLFTDQSDIISLAIPYLVIVLVSAPFLLFILLKKVKQLIQTTEHLKFWSFIWIIPLSFYLVYRISISPRYLSVVVKWDDAGAITPLLWTIATMLSNYLIIEMLLGVVRHVKKEKELQLANQMLDIQTQQYQKQQANIEEIRKMKHDFRHHFVAMSGMLEKKDYANLGEYMKQYITEIEFSETLSLCDNYALNALLQYYMEHAKEQNIRFTTDILLPDTLKCTNSELCVLFGNLLENAFEACNTSSGEEKYISVVCKFSSNCTFAFVITNSHESIIKCKNNAFLSKKRDYTQKGIGLASVESIVKKYYGHMQIEHDNSTFQVSVLL